jgi:hypothetical protein
MSPEGMWFFVKVGSRRTGSHPYGLDGRMPLDRIINLIARENMFKEPQITTIKSGILCQMAQYLISDLIQCSGYIEDHTIAFPIGIHLIITDASKIKVGYMMMLDVMKEFG